MEAVRLPAINLIDMSLANKPITTNLGKNDSPDEPVEGTRDQDSDTDNAVDVVRHALVLVLAGIVGSDEWCDHQVHVAEKEEDGDGEGRLDRRVPVVLCAVKVEMDETTSDKGVDDRERVRDEVENEVVGISRRRSQDDNNADDPVLKETSERSVERSVAGPETREGQNTLATELLDKTTLREDDTEDVSESRQSDKDRHGALSSRAHDVAEERSSDETLRGNDLSFGDGSEVSDVDEDVDDRDGDDGSRSSDLEGSHGVASLAEGVVGVAVTDKTPDDVVQSSDNTISAAGSTLKGVLEVVGLLVSLEMTAKGNKTADDHDEDDEELDDAESILKTKPPFESTSMDEERSGDTSQTNTTLVPAINLGIRSMEDILSKDDRVTRSPAHEKNVRSVDAGDEELGLAVDELEIILLTTVLGDTGSPFEVHGRTSSGDDGTDYPDDESKTWTAEKSEDRAGCSKDTGSNDTVEDEHRRAQNTDLAFVIGGVLKTALFAV